MAEYINEFDSNSISKLQIPGSTYPALYWAIPVGKWKQSQMDEYFRNFKRADNYITYKYGIFIAKRSNNIAQRHEGQDINDGVDSKGVLDLSKLLPLENFKINDNVSSLLILSSAFPQPGYGLLIDNIKIDDYYSHKEQISFLDYDIIKSILSNATNRIDFNYNEMEEYFDIYRDYRYLTDELDELEKSELNEKQLYLLNVIVNSIKNKEFKKIDELLKDHNHENIFNFILKKFYQNKNKEIKLSLKFLANDAIINEIKTQISSFYDLKIKPNEINDSNNYMDIIKLSYTLFKDKESIPGNLLNWSEKIIFDFIKNSEDIILLNNNQIIESKNNLKREAIEFQKKINRIYDLQLKFGPEFLIKLEKVCLERGLNVSTISWDKPRMVAWKILSCGVSIDPLDLEAEINKNAILNQNIKNIVRNEVIKYKDFNGSHFTDFIHYISTLTSELSKRDLTKLCLSGIRASDHEKIYLYYDRKDFQTVDMENLLTILGWETELDEYSTKPLKYFTETIIISSINEKIVHFINARKSLENFCKDLFHLTKIKILPSILDEHMDLVILNDLGYKIEEAKYIEKLTIGKVDYILKSLWKEYIFFSNEILESKIDPFFDTIKKLSHIFNTVPHDIEDKNLRGEQKLSFESTSSDDLSKMIKLLLETAEDFFSELPWHLEPEQTFGRSPAVVSGIAWSHSYAQPKVIRVLMDYKNASQKKLLVWNPSKINPVMSEAKILKKY